MSGRVRSAERALAFERICKADPYLRPTQVTLLVDVAAELVAADDLAKARDLLNVAVEGWVASQVVEMLGGRPAL